MEPETTRSELPEHATHVKLTEQHHGAAPHHVRPIDRGFRVIVRTILWVIAGAVLIGLCVWWTLT